MKEIDDVNAWMLEQATKGRDHGTDRQLGETWERHFCRLAAAHGRSFTPQQIGHQGSAKWYAPSTNGINPLLLPDVTIWTAPGEHHEIKHKAPTGSQCFGLEKYRLEALRAFRRETQQPVMYTIHDWQLAGAARSSDPMPNRMDHWRTVDVAVLEDYVIAEHLEAPPVHTYVNGRWEWRPCYYWPVTLWRSLRWWWQ